jgi:hypothetical protein
VRVFIVILEILDFHASLHRSKLILLFLLLLEKLMEGEEVRFACSTWIELAESPSSEAALGLSLMSVLAHDLGGCLPSPP